jgi:outer membrane protein TolC
MRHIIRSLIVLLAMSLATPSIIRAEAGEPLATRESDLKGLIAEATENNPRIKAARLRWQASQEKYAQVTSLSDPRLSYTLPIQEVETRLGPQEHILSIKQQLPFPGSLGVRGEAATKEAEIAKASLNRLIRDTTFMVKEAFYELYYINRAIAIGEENRTLLNYLKEVNRTNYGLDLGDLDELVRAEKYSAAAEYELIKLSDQQTSAYTKLNTILNTKQSRTFNSTEEITYKPFIHSLDEIKALALKNFDELKIAALVTEKSEINKKLARYNYLPNFNLGVNYIAIGEPRMSQSDGGEDAYALTFGVNIPIWFKKYSAHTNEAILISESMRAEEAAIATALLYSIDKSYSTLLNSEKLLNLYKDSFIPEAKGSVEFAESKYKHGEESLSKLLETQSMWLNFRLTYEKAFRDFMLRIIELERLTGTELN